MVLSYTGTQLYEFYCPLNWLSWSWNWILWIHDRFIFAEIYNSICFLFLCLFWTIFVQNIQFLTVFKQMQAEDSSKQRLRLNWPTETVLSVTTGCFFFPKCLDVHRSDKVLDSCPALLKGMKAKNISYYLHLPCSVNITSVLLSPEDVNLSGLQKLQVNN